jgi:G3E family GTPase
MITQPLDFIVLTGFLGSGKTTLLVDFLASPEATDTAVIVNEAGEIGLDGAIIAESGGDVPMAMLASGCICCRMGSDLAVTIRALIDAQRPGREGSLRRIILETSGLSKPGPILRQLAELADLRMRVAVVATYDLLRGIKTANFDEAVAQWAAAHRIVTTKVDAVPPERQKNAVRDLKALNPFAEVVVAPDRATTVARTFAKLNAPAVLQVPSIEGATAHSRIAVRLVTPVNSLSYDQLGCWLDNLGGTLGERLLRLKGIVRVTDVDRPLLVQSVGTLFAQPRLFGPPDAAERSYMVIIARDVRRGELDGIAPAGLFVVAV